MKISIGFSKHNGFAPIGKAIAWYMDRPFSHTYLKIKMAEFDKESVFQSIGKGVMLMSYESFLIVNTPVSEFEIEISEELHRELCQDFHKFAGQNYGYAQNAGIVLTNLLRKVGLKITKNPISEGINCSEWVAYCLEEIDPIRWDSTKQDFNLVDPGEIFDYLSGNENFRLW